MVDKETIRKIVDLLLQKIETKDQEIGRLLVLDPFDKFDDRIDLWAIRKSVLDLKETTVTDLDEIRDIEIKLTFAPPTFFSHVIEGRDVPYWQIATVSRLLNHGNIVYDPHGQVQEWIDNLPRIEWNPEIVSLKRKTTQMLLERMKNRIREDMLADAYIWLIKSAEEAFCIPLMENKAFNVGTASLMLDTLRRGDQYLYGAFHELLRVSSFNVEKLERARSELERLADHLFQENIKTDREMWILSAFVSINESERRLIQYKRAVKEGSDSQETVALFDTAVGELWQAYFLVAQYPRSKFKLDPYVVSSFWNWFGFEDINEEWLIKQGNEILSMVGTSE
ncbi:MAG: hypothetical protein ACFFE8_08305 [Candidatus Heimdallarchaeota archaeon]